MFRYFPLVLKNCWRNRRRTILTVASIAVSMCLLGVMITMYDAFYLRAPSADEALRLVVRNRVSLAVEIPLSYRDRIRHVPGVQEVMIMNWFGGVYKDSRDPKNMFARFAVEPEKMFAIFGEMRVPEDQKKAFLQDRTGCLIGRDLGNSLGFKIGDRIPIVGDIYPGNFEFTVRAIYDWPRASDNLYFNKEYLDQSLPPGRRGRVGMFYVRIDDPGNTGRITSEVDEMFRNSPAETKTETEQAFSVGFLSLLGNVKMFLMAIAGAVTFTILLVSANTMAMSVRERVREVGVLKTLGFAPAAVLGLILGEAVSISLAGGLAGYVVSMGLMRVVAKSPFGIFLPAIPAVQPRIAAACLLVAGLVGFLSALLPALGASRMPIVQALRSTD